MTGLTPETINVKGFGASLLRSENLSRPLVFIHGGTPGKTPYCAGAHLWAPVLERIAARRNVLAVDLPGAGGTVFSAGFSVEACVNWTGNLLDALGIDRCFLVGHDIGGLVALDLAMARPALVAGTTVTSSVVAAPTGDGVENLTLAHPPLPLWTRHSQRWAFERLSYAPSHITASLLNACVEAAGKPPHLAAAAAMADSTTSGEFASDIMRAKARLYTACREKGVPSPTQVIWGSHDRLGSVDQGLWLYRLVAAKQTAAHFHIINRTGSFPFREDPETFLQVVESFCDAVFPHIG